MSFEHCKLQILIKRIGLEVKARRVNMRRGNFDAVTHRALAEHGKNNSLVLYVEPDLIAALISLGRIKLFKSVFLSLVQRKCRDLTLGFVFSEEILVALAPGKRFLYLAVIQAQRRMLWRRKKLLTQFLRRSFLILHFIPSFHLLRSED